MNQINGYPPQRSISFLPLLLIGLSFVGGYFFHQYQVSGEIFSNPIDLIQSSSNQAKEPAGFDKFWQVWDLIQKRYLDSKSITEKSMVDGAISGLVASLGDPYTSYFTTEENTNFKDGLEGLYEGIGAQLGFKDNQLAIIAPMDDTPALKAGIRAGDFIVAVDDESTTGWSVEQAVNKIRGKAGTTVTLTIVRGSFEPIKISIERQQIQIPAVRLTWRDGNIAQIRVLRFGSDTNAEWDKVVGEIASKNATGIVLDVRNNPGGLLDAAIHLGSEFFDSGVIVKRQSVDETIELDVDHRCRFCSIKTVVLINEGSASASEILAGALQARGRAKLIGVTSFGKGTVQEAVDLSEGAAVHITTAKWLLPIDQNIHKVGLTPDYEVKIDDTMVTGPYDDSVIDPQLQKALEVIRQ